MKTWMLWIGLGSMIFGACQSNKETNQSTEIFQDAHTDSIEVVENDFLFIPGEHPKAKSNGANHVHSLSGQGITYMDRGKVSNVTPSHPVCIKFRMLA